LLAIVRAAIDGASARRAVLRALAAPIISPLLSRPTHVLAAGKAAAAMATAVAASPLDLRTVVAIGTHRPGDLAERIEWIEAAHPVPDERSIKAGVRALQLAAGVAADECLLLLLSGGASALMALPIEGISLPHLQRTIQSLMLGGADIHTLNTVRKHFSQIKGGRLAAACPGTTVTLAVSDVIGDDLSVIGSGPGVADRSTWADAARALTRYGRHDDAVHDVAGRGARGELPDTPKPGDRALARASGFVIASRPDAMAAASDAATQLGYRVVTIADEVAGEARQTAPAWFAKATTLIADLAAPACVISAGETTVRVRGRGRGGRNQEFALALADLVAAASRELIVASIGTDGIDGPTDAAGALVDRTTRSRAALFGLDAAGMLAENNAYDYFAMLGDLIHLGPTDTNVGDVQVLLASAAAAPRS
jgi:hydroxypyruvate reductase